MTLEQKMVSAGGFTSAFDYLRIGLAVGVLLFHSIALSQGTDYQVVTGEFRFIPVLILPMFFALSGFLVTGSLKRVKLHQFVSLRIARLIPALAVEILLSAMIIGPLITTYSLAQYFTDQKFTIYFLNVFGYMHYYLPGVFTQNPYPGITNGQLWTIPFELECYFGLIALALIGLVPHRGWFVLVVMLGCLILTARLLILHNADHAFGAPGRMLVATFLAAVGLYLYKDVIPFAAPLGIAAFAAAAVCLQYVELSYLAAFPVAYATIWIGLMRPPRIPFGDLSYGVYLFHWPVEQLIVHELPFVRVWWLLSLIALPLTMMCAWLSWNLIENPVLSRKRQILAASDRIMAAAILVTGRLRRTAV